MGDESDGSSSTESCSMTGLLGILIQVGLGVLSFSVLIIKRFREHPQRPWKIWLFDTSKQLVSQMIAHFINLTISLALAYNDSSSDECLWYFMTNILDNTIGVLLCIMCLRAIQWSLTRRNLPQYISGNYYTKSKVIVQIEIMDLGKGKIKDTINVGMDYSEEYSNKREMNEEKADKSEIESEKGYSQDEGREGFNQEGREYPQEGRQANDTQTLQKYQINYKAWLVQLLIWVSVVIIGKGCLFGFEYGLKGPLKSFSVSVMGWIEAYPVLELLVVMILVPVIMNGLAFWIQDNILMKKADSKYEGESPLIEEQTTQREPALEL